MNNISKLANPAPHGKRLMANFLDAAIMAIVSNLVAALTQVNAGFIYLLVSLAYVVINWKTATTPGKHMMGLILIDTSERGALSFWQVLGREGIGKMLSFITLLLGYLWILLNKEHKAFHDKLFNTQVVTYKVSHSQFSIMRFLAKSFAVYIVLSAISYFVLFHTALPLKGLAQQLAAHGVHIDDIRGNLSQGFVLGSLRASTAELDVEIDDLSFTYKHLVMQIVKGETHINMLGANRFVINFKDSSRQFPAPSAAALLGQSMAPSKSTEDKTQDINKAKQRKLFEKLPPVTIAAIDLLNIQILSNGEKQRVIEKAQLRNWTFINRQTNIAHIFLQSEGSFLEVKQLAFADGVVTTPLVRGLISNKLFPSQLAGAVDFTANIKTHIHKKTVEGEFKAFRNAINVLFLPESRIKVTVKDFNPHWYFKDMPPVYMLNASIEDKLISAMLAPKISGDYTIRNRKFYMNGSPSMGSYLSALTTMGSVQTSQGQFSSLQMQSRMMSPSQKRDPAAPPVKIVLTPLAVDGPILTVHEALSLMYYNKDFSALSPQERSLVFNDSRYFSLSSNRFNPLINAGFGAKTNYGLRLPAGDASAVLQKRGASRQSSQRIIPPDFKPEALPAGR